MFIPRIKKNPLKNMIKRFLSENLQILFFKKMRLSNLNKILLKIVKVFLIKSNQTYI